MQQLPTLFLSLVALVHMHKMAWPHRGDGRFGQHICLVGCSYVMMSYTVLWLGILSASRIGIAQRNWLYLARYGLQGLVGCMEGIGLKWYGK